ncbi:MAG: type 4a pilus biogenesis protein PilO [Psychrobium sp.]|nr:type 4a pilus biogenesis protein PilO [Psychrobium sp.]
MAIKLTDFQDLDFNQSGSWPKSVKMVALSVLFVGTHFLGYYFVISDQLSQLEAAAKNETKLRLDYQSKYRLADNLPAYQQQIQQLKQQLGQMLKKLPATHETPGLLDDITFIATTAGLRIKAIKWGDEDELEFYTELPLFIDVTGSFHQFGRFVSDVAKLPRIVSLHEFDIKKSPQSTLSFHVVAKTYRYKEAK